MNTIHDGSSDEVHISVITVVSKDQTGLEKTRVSLESQYFTNWTHIIVDSGLDDDVLEYLHNLPMTNSKWVSESDYGIYNAMNKALKMVEDESYAFFLNERDTFANHDSLNVAANVLREYSNPNWACTTHEEITEDGETWLCKLVSKPSIRNQLYATGYRSHQAVVMKKSFIDSLGGFDESLKVAADWELIVKAMIAEEPITWSEPIACFEIGGFSTQRILLAHKELHELRKKYLLKNYKDYIYDYLWRSLFLYPIGYRTFIGRLLFPAFKGKNIHKKSFMINVYRKFVIKEHGNLVHKIPTRSRRILLKSLYYIYPPFVRSKLFHFWRTLLNKRLNLNEIEAA